MVSLPLVSASWIQSTLFGCQNSLKIYCISPLEGGLPGGDFNGDGNWDLDDVNGLLAVGPISCGVVVDPTNQQFDLTDDGVINLADLDEWLAIAASENGLGSPYRLGDGNLDGTVDGGDFIAWNGSKFSPSLE